MKQKVKLWDKKLFVEGIRQTRGVGAAALLLYGFVFLMGSIYNTGNGYYALETNMLYSETVILGVFYGLYISKVLIYYLFVPLMMFKLFGFMNKRTNSDFYHAVPKNRLTVCITYYTVVLAWACVLLAVCKGGASLLQIPLEWMDVIPGSILAMGAVCIGMNMTGTVLTNILATVLILFVPRIVLNQFVAVLYEIAPFLPENAAIGKITDSSYQIIFSSLTSIGGEGPGEEQSVQIIAAIYSTFLGVVYSVLGGVLFCRRKSEAAGRPGVNRLCQNILRITLTFVCVLSVLSIVAERFVHATNEELDVPSLIIWSVIGILVYFAFELITTRKWKSVAKALRWLPLTIAIFAVVCFGLATGVKVVSNYVPDASEITEMRVMSGFEMTDGDGYYYDYIQAGKGELYKCIPITDREAIELIQKQLDKEMETYKESATSYDRWCKNPSLQLAFYKGDTSFERILHFTPDDYETIRECVGEAAKDVYDYEQPSTELYPAQCIAFGWDFSDKQLNDLYECLREELKRTNPPITVFLGREYNQTRVFDFLECYGDGEMEIPISLDTPKTLELLANMGNKSRKDFDFQWFTDYITENKKTRTATLEVILYTDEERGIQREGLEWKGKYGSDIKDEQLLRMNEILSSYEETEVSVEENLLVLVYKNVGSSEYVPTTGRWYNISDADAEEIRELINMNGTFDRYKYFD